MNPSIFFNIPIYQSTCFLHSIINFYSRVYQCFTLAANDIACFFIDNCFGSNFVAKYVSLFSPLKIISPISKCIPRTQNIIVPAFMDNKNTLFTRSFFND